ncbi:MAG TPA: hypothetical protein PK264_03155, partial [Hyphomicrobiaceae bacterium]|nr:hypothetical protein [Hyphomicrobiaceae bacterium]
GHQRRLPDVILADYHLDHGTGLDAIAVVCATTQTSIPAVIITADRSPGLQRDLKLAGHAYLSKPVKAGALRALLAQLALRRNAAE